jgi:hypothetical protein
MLFLRIVRLHLRVVGPSCGRKILPFFGATVHCKKDNYFPSPAGMSIIKLSLALFPAWDSLINDIPAGDGKIVILLYSVKVLVPVNGEIAISNSRYVVVLQVDDSLGVLHNRTAINSVEYTVPIFMYRKAVFRIRMFLGLLDPHPDP